MSGHKRGRNYGKERNVEIVRLNRKYAVTFQLVLYFKALLRVFYLTYYCNIVGMSGMVTSLLLVYSLPLTLDVLIH